MKKSTKRIFCAMMIASIMAACTKPNTLTGKIDGLTNDTLLIRHGELTRAEGGYSQLDTIIAENGSFFYQLNEKDAMYVLHVAQLFVHDRPTGGIYMPDYGNIEFTKANGKGVHITASIDSIMHNLKIKGGYETNPLHAEIQNRINEITANMVAEEMAFEQAMMDNDQAGQAKGLELRQARNIKKRAVYAEYIRKYSDTPLAAMLVSNYAPLDSMEVFYNVLGDKAKNSIFNNLLERRMESYRRYAASRLARETIVVGGKAPDFSAIDTADNRVYLSDIEKPLRVLDFWGSWCGPCISGMPQMKEFYAKHNDKVEIIGIACNERSVEKWRDAVADLQLPWINLLNETDINVQYGIEAYPTKIVIDSDNTILLRYTGEGEEFYKELADLVKKL